MLRRLAKVLTAARQYPGRTFVAITFLVALGLAGYHAVRHLQAQSRLDNATRALERWDFKQARNDLAFCLEAWPRDGATPNLLGQMGRQRCATS